VVAGVVPKPRLMAPGIAARIGGKKEGTYDWAGADLAAPAAGADLAARLSGADERTCTLGGPMRRPRPDWACSTQNLSGGALDQKHVCCAQVRPKAFSSRSLDRVA